MQGRAIITAAFNQLVGLKINGFDMRDFDYLTAQLGPIALTVNPDAPEAAQRHRNWGVTDHSDPALAKLREFADAHNVLLNLNAREVPGFPVMDFGVWGRAHLDMNVARDKDGVWTVHAPIKYRSAM